MNFRKCLYLQVKELRHDYTHCDNMNNPGQTCAAFLDSQPVNNTGQTCYCKETITLTEDFVVRIVPAMSHPPRLIRAFAVRIKKAWVLSYPLSAQRRLRSDWVDVQADLSLRWAYSHFVGYVVRRLSYVKSVFTKFILLRQTNFHLVWINVLKCLL